MAAATDQRKCWLMLLLFVYKVCLPDLAQAVATSGNESGIVERVNRRQTTDIYFINSSSMSCEDKNTYLINEDQCVNDQELFLGNFYS
jgi:NAD-dependent dihydropyrimidine dehydrogenase PreA subunit